ncbi:hypothetical protein Godav_005215, partial [Gossypium davidsonii]|nr:hypothetical protein [Gossypium davidsonii]
HGVKECNGILTDERDKPEDELPYSLVLKLESSLLEKESLKSDFSTKKSVKQCSYIGDVVVFNGVYGKFSEDEADGSRGGLCLVWKRDVTVSLRSFSKNHLNALVKEDSDDKEWRFTGFYRAHFANSNKIMYSFEKAGGMPREERRMEAFQDVLEECQLMDVGYLEEWFTLEIGNLPKTNIRER